MSLFRPRGGSDEPVFRPLPRPRGTGPAPHSPHYGADVSFLQRRFGIMRRILDTYWYCGSIRAAEAPTLRLLGRMVDLGVYAIYDTDRTAAQPISFCVQR